MSNNTLKHLFAVFFPLILGQLFVACKQGNPEVGASLDRIEQVVQQRPDSALIELVHLDSLLDAGAVSIEGDRQMARYALLKTQTHDKNWIDDIYEVDLHTDNEGFRHLYDVDAKSPLPILVRVTQKL